MSERFTDEVLQRVHEAGERAYIEAKHELVDDWQAIDAARFAAMRAVLEGHLEAERLEAIKQYELSRQRMAPLEAKIREQERVRIPLFRDSGVRVKGNVVLVSDDPEINAFLDRMGGIVAVDPEKWR